MNKRFTIIIVSFLLIFCASCSKTESDTQLHQIASKVNDNAEEALESLNRINYDSLNDEDRHFYDFLLIKAKDKSYITHTNDSLYLDVLNYYSAQKESEIYPEVLYYGGRVYRDMGDYPTALQYFHNSLDKIHRMSNHGELKSCVLNQIGGVLNSLRLYDNAIPFIKQAVETDSINKDSIGIMLGTQLLGALYLHLNKLDTAEIYFNQALRLAELVSPEDISQEFQYLATVYSKTGRHDSAKKLISSIFQKNQVKDKDNALANAAGVYYRAQVYDSAFLYANEIVKLKDSKNIRYALSLVLSPELIKFIPFDSLQHYISEYQRVTEKEFNKNADNEALLQNTFYNYTIHDKRREQAESKNLILIYLIEGIVFLVLVLIIIVLFQRYRNKSNEVELFQSMEKLRLLQEALDSKEEKIKKTENSELTIENLDEECRQRRYVEELQALKARTTVMPKTCTAIKDTETYKAIKSCLLKNKSIGENNRLWKDLEDLVTRESSTFVDNVKSLGGEKLQQKDLHLALLIKSGFSQSEAGALLGKSKSGMFYRRGGLSKALFGSQLDVDTLIKLVLSL